MVYNGVVKLYSSEVRTLPRKSVRDWLFVTEAASEIGVSRQQIHNLLRAGFFPNAVYTNASYLLYKPDVDRVKHARELGLFKSGRPAGNFPMLTYDGMIKALKDLEASA